MSCYKNAIPQNSGHPDHAPLDTQKNTWIFLSKKQKNINFFFKMNKKSRYIWHEKKSQFLGVGEEPFLNLVMYLSLKVGFHQRQKVEGESMIW